MKKKERNIILYIEPDIDIPVYAASDIFDILIVGEIGELNLVDYIDNIYLSQLQNQKRIMANFREGFFGIFPDANILANVRRHDF